MNQIATDYAAKGITFIGINANATEMDAMARPLDWVGTMRFAYYRSLSRKDKAIYDASDRILSIALPRAEALHPTVDILRQALERDDRPLVEAVSSRLVLGIGELLEVEPVDVKVLAVRPELRSAELHGLYTRDDARRPRIRVWMRTLRYKRVVAFRTFLHAAPRGLPSPRLHAARPRGFVPHPGLLQPRKQPVQAIGTGKRDRPRRRLTLRLWRAHPGAARSCCSSGPSCSSC